MPDLKTLLSRTQTQGAIPAFNRASPRDFATGAGAATQATGSAFEQLGNALNKIQLHMEAVEQETLANRAMTDAQRQLDEYAFRLEHGGIGEDGKLLSPAPPASRLGMFQKYAEGVKAQGAALFGDDTKARNKFETDFADYQHTQEMVVKKTAVPQFRAQVIAEIDAGLATLAQSAADADPLLQPQIQERVKEHVRVAVNSGNITFEQGEDRIRDFQKKVQQATLVRYLRESPGEISRYLKTADGLTPKEREEWKTRAIEKIEQRDRDAIAARADEARIIEKARKEQRDAVLKDLYARDADGELTREELDAMRDTLPEAHYRRLLTSVSTSREEKEKQERERQAGFLTSRNDQVKAYIEESIRNGRRDAVDQLPDLVDQGMLSPLEAEQYREKFSSAVHSQVASVLKPLPASERAQAESEMDRYIQENPKATVDEVSDKASAVLKSYLFRPSKAIRYKEVATTNARGIRSSRLEIDKAHLKNSITEMYEDGASAEDIERVMALVKAFREAKIK